MSMGEIDNQHSPALPNNQGQRQSLPSRLRPELAMSWQCCVSCSHKEPSHATPMPPQEAIMWMAEHVDLILVFLDPIGQATCRRTMEVVERLNNSAHLEKLQYFMSKVRCYGGSCCALPALGAHRRLVRCVSCVVRPTVCLFACLSVVRLSVCLSVWMMDGFDGWQFMH